MFWVANRSFGITWVCTQVRVHKYVKASGYAFKKVQDEESEESEEEITDEEDSVPVAEKTQNDEDSGSEEEVEVDA
jgi:hypothetical protein